MFFLLCAEIRYARNVPYMVTFMCHQCQVFLMRNRPPPRSLAAGVDFGRLDIFPDLNLAEKLILSAVRIIIPTMKLTTVRSHQSRALKGNIVNLADNLGPRLAQRLTLDDLVDRLPEMISIVFVGTEQEWREAINNGQLDPATRKALDVRPQQLVSAFRILADVNSLYCQYIDLHDLEAQAAARAAHAAQQQAGGDPMLGLLNLSQIVNATDSDQTTLRTGDIVLSEESGSVELGAGPAAAGTGAGAGSAAGAGAGAAAGAGVAAGAGAGTAAGAGAGAAAGNASQSSVQPPSGSAALLGAPAALEDVPEILMHNLGLNDSRIIAALTLQLAEDINIPLAPAAPNVNAPDQPPVPPSAPPVNGGAGQ